MVTFPPSSALPGRCVLPVDDLLQLVEASLRLDLIDASRRPLRADEPSHRTTPQPPAPRTGSVVVRSGWGEADSLR